MGERMRASWIQKGKQNKEERKKTKDSNKNEVRIVVYVCASVYGRADEQRLLFHKMTVAIIHRIFGLMFRKGYGQSPPNTALRMRS